MLTCLQGALGAKKQPAPAPLTEAGETLKARYAARLEALKADIQKQLPAVDEARKAAYMAAREAEKTAEQARNAAQGNLGKVHSAQGLVNHAKGKWIGGAERGIAAAKAKLEAAKTDEEREAAKKELAGWEKNKQDGLDALKERQAKLDDALRQQPQWTKELEAAQDALAKAQAATAKALDDLGLGSLLASDKLDAELAEFAVLAEGTPQGLAAFAQQGKAQEKLLKQLLSDPELMWQMVVADGARGGKYGPAMEIYTAIQKASKKAGEGVLQRLALAVALEHAVPRPQRSATALTDAPKTVDPVKRYLSYEKAYLADELDPGFKGMDVWDYRMVVNGEEPDEISAWGREMLRNYRPDHITTDDYRWRYVAAVRTDVRYGSQCNKYDKPELQFFQNILMNGGVCGRRAFFGRFILRAFGIPTTARPQRGHAALAHWTPDGWVVCLGGGWGAGWVSPTRGKAGREADRDFLAVTQAREEREAYMQVVRAQRIGDVVGEPQTWGLLSGTPAFWNGVALYTQRGIIADARSVTLAAVGEELGEANESDVKYAIETAPITEADRKISVAENGVITIPAAATSKPTESTGKLIFMPSNLGGLQLHYNRTGGAQPFEYTFDAPKAGTYALTARVVTPSWKQTLTVSANGNDAVDIALPFTVGMWDQTEPVELALAKGKNVLTFTRDHEWLKGLTIRDFTLTPKGK
jgi:hypothetical protein